MQNHIITIIIRSAFIIIIHLKSHKWYIITFFLQNCFVNVNTLKTIHP